MEKNSVRDLQYGPKTRLIRGINEKDRERMKERKYGEIIAQFQFLTYFRENIALSTINLLLRNCRGVYPMPNPFWVGKLPFPSTTVNDCIINMNKSQNQKVFSTTSQPSKSSFSPFGPFYRPKWLISLPFQIPETWKWYPLRAEPPRLSIIGTTPPPPPPPPRLGLWRNRHPVCLTGLFSFPVMGFKTLK